MDKKVKKLTVLAMLTALSFSAAAIGRIPVVLFLKFDPKDALIVLGGFIYGPVSALVIAVLSSLIEMLTVSDTGIIGFFMNVLSSSIFAVTASVIYRKKRDMAGALLGLVCGGLLMTGAMLLWNYIVTPVYMNYPREEVAKLLVPAFLPFNLIKSALNCAITLLIYKPIVNAMRRAKILEPSNGTTESKKSKWVVAGIALLVIAACVLSILYLRGII